MSWSSSGSTSDRGLALAARERVEHEAGQARREDGVAAGDTAHRVGQLGPGDRLRHVAARAGADDADHVVGRIRDAQREEAHGRPPRRDAADHLDAAAVRHLHVEQHHVGLRGDDAVDRLADRAGVADDVDEAFELGAHAGAEQAVVVDEHDARQRGHQDITSSTSVPSPGRVWIAARPPWRSIRPSTDSRRPRRSGGIAARSKPGPRSRTKTSARSPSISA